MSPADPTERLRALCAEVGFELERVEPSVVARIRLLAEHTETVTDSEHMVGIARGVFRHYEETKPPEAFSEVERRTVVLGCLFSDIGKTGPASAVPREQRLVAEMFAVEGVRDDTQPVSQFLSTYFPTDAEERRRRFSALGLQPAMTIRQFWNLHSTWTLQIVEAGGVPPEAIAAAATHHLLDDINPERIVGADGRFTRSFGANATFDRAEKLVIVLDKYDAIRRRGSRSHAEAIAWLRDRVRTSSYFRSDAEFSTLITDLDTVAGP